MRPVLLAGVSAARNGNGVTLLPHVALFLIRQVLDTFHCPVLVEPMAQALIWSTVPAALAYAPWLHASSSCGEGAARTDQHQQF